MSSTLEDRLKLIIADLERDAYGRWTRLQGSTAISATRWKNVSQGTQRPAPDMIEAIAQLAPQYAFWLATGISDPAYGHVAPRNEGYPSPGQEQPSSTRYFKDAIAEKKLAMSDTQDWIDAERLEHAQNALESDVFVREIHLVARNPTTLKAQTSKRLKSAKLRATEIAMHEDVPNPDQNTAETVLKAIDQEIEPHLNKEALEGRHGETSAIENAVNLLKLRVALHRQTKKQVNR